MSRRRRGSWKEQRAIERARERRASGDPLPYMMILDQERDRLGIIIPVNKSRKVVNVFGPGGTL